MLAPVMDAVDQADRVVADGLGAEMAKAREGVNEIDLLALEHGP
jgi:hypothetical protein